MKNTYGKNIFDEAILMTSMRKYNEHEIRSLVHPFIKNEGGRKMIYFKSGRLDYQDGYLFRGITKSGGLKLGQIYGDGPQGIQFKNRVSRLEEYPQGSFYFKSGERGARTYLNVLRRN